jgi:hypothetical protein
LTEPKPESSTCRLSLLADVSETTLADLFGEDTTVLAVAVRRVVDSVEQSAQTISGWSSYVDSPTGDASSPGSNAGEEVPR